jgi:ELWxxDGT repeat protein
MTYELLFGATDGVHGDEPWITNGTPAGTHILKDINPAGSSDPRYITAVTSLLLISEYYFSADDGTSGRELWITTGSEAGTKRLADINPGSSGSVPLWLTPLNGSLIFAADDGTHGNELFISDGTAAGTKILKDIRPGSGDSNPGNLKYADGKIYFTADDGVNGSELWVTDGTAAHTFMIKNINTNTSGSDDSYPSGFTAYNGKVYFSATDGDYGFQLYVTDGTATGTQMVKRMGPAAGSYPDNLIVFDGYLYFCGLEASSSQLMYRTDGTTIGTVVFPAKQTLGDGYSIPWIIYNNRLWFWMKNVFSGVEFWSTDGTEAGTVLLKDINPGTNSSSPGYHGTAVMDDNLYFSAINDDQQNSQVWVTDGTSSGTRMIMPAIAPLGMPLYHNRQFKVWGGNLYFTAAYNTEGTELWKIIGKASAIGDVAAEYPSVRVWPNPASSELHVSCNPPARILLHDITGKLILEKMVTGECTINLEGFAPGTYILREAGNRFRQKVVVR